MITATFPVDCFPKKNEPTEIIVPPNRMMINIKVIALFLLILMLYKFTLVKEMS